MRVNLKSALVSAHVLQPPNWEEPFKIMCDASNFVVGAILGQRKEGKPYVIYYASKLHHYRKGAASYCLCI